MEALILFSFLALVASGLLVSTFITEKRKKKQRSTLKSFGAHLKQFRIAKGLSGADLSGCNLTDANFTGSNLAGTRFSGVKDKSLLKGLETSKNLDSAIFD